MTRNPFVVDARSDGKFSVIYDIRASDPALISRLLIARNAAVADIDTAAEYPYFSSREIAEKIAESAASFLSADEIAACQMTAIEHAARNARALSESIRAAIAETGEPGGRGPLSAALNALATQAAILSFALTGCGAGMPGLDEKQ